jgi:hypothetical protein
MAIKRNVSKKRDTRQMNNTIRCHGGSWPSRHGKLSPQFAFTVTCSVTATQIARIP